jgi:hypothetical protein
VAALRVLGRVPAVGLALVLQAAFVLGVELLWEPQAVILLQQVAVVEVLETVSTLGVPLILQVALVLEVGPALQVMTWLQQEAVLRALATVSVGFPVISQVVMMPEIDLHLELQVVIWLKQLVVWELAPERPASIPGFEFSGAQRQRVIQPSVP